MILHNGHRPSRARRPPTRVDVNGMSIEIRSPYQSTKYFGRKMQFDEYHATEIENRIATALRTFHALKSELTIKHYSLDGRLRLFHGTITPTVLYGGEAWTTTK